MCFLSKIDQQTKNSRASLSKQYSHIKTKSVMKVHFFNEIIWFLAGGGPGNQNPARPIVHSPPGVKETLNYCLRGQTGNSLRSPKDRGELLRSFVYESVILIRGVSGRAPGLPRTEQLGFLNCWATYSKNYKSNPVIKLHFFNEIIWFLIRIDLQVENSRSSLSKHGFNIKSNPIINVHLFQAHHVLFIKNWSASQKLAC